MWSEQAYLGDVWMSEDVVGGVQDDVYPNGRMCIDDAIYAKTCLDMPTFTHIHICKTNPDKEYPSDAQDEAKYPTQQHFQAHTPYRSLQLQGTSSDLYLQTGYAHIYMQHTLKSL